MLIAQIRVTSFLLGTFGEILADLVPCAKARRAVCKSANHFIWKTELAAAVNALLLNWFTAVFCNSLCFACYSESYVVFVSFVEQTTAFYCKGCSWTQQSLYGMQQTAFQENNPLLLRDVCQKTWIAPRCMLQSIPHPKKLQTIKLFTASYLWFHFPCFLTCVLPSLCL